jgi:hypothetical protein
MRTATLHFVVASALFPTFLHCKTLKQTSLFAHLTHTRCEFTAHIFAEGAAARGALFAACQLVRLAYLPARALASRQLTCNARRDTFPKIFLENLGCVCGHYRSDAFDTIFENTLDTMSQSELRHWAALACALKLNSYNAVVGYVDKSNVATVGLKAWADLLDDLGNKILIYHLYLQSFEFLFAINDITAPWR